jgi:TolB-like protein/Tfp pilus assembly protein PilF
MRDLESLKLVAAGDDARGRAPEKNVSKRELPALAVLPFSSIKPDPETDFLGFALADEIIGALTYMDRIAVRASSAVRKYQNQAVDVAVAAKELHADFVLAGHYLKQADMVRLNVELVTADSSDLVWRESIEVKYENAFKLQDMVAKKVLRGLKVQFPKAAKTEVQADVPANPIAYEYYLRGLSYPTTLTDNRLAIEMLEKSIKLDSKYAPAHAELGYRVAQEANYGLVGAEGHQRAEKAFRKSLSLNENQPKALYSLAIYYIETGNYEEALELIQRMLRVTPNNAMAHFVRSYLCRYTGMLDESIAEVEKALELDPKNTRFRSAGFTYLYSGDYRKAYERFQLDTKSAPPIAWQGWALLLMGEKKPGMECLDRAIALEPGGFVGHRFGAIKAYFVGEIEEGLRLLRNLDDLLPTKSDSEQLYAIADTYALLGDKAACIRSLNRAIQDGFFNYPAMLKNPWLAPLRDDPDYQQVLEMAKKKHEAFKIEFSKRGG